MKSVFVPLFALLALSSAVAEDAITSPIAPSETPEIGRFEMADSEMGFVLLDTATGRLWQVQRRSSKLALVPVTYEHPEGVSTHLPDYVPEPIVDPRKPKVTPEVAAERIANAQEFVKETINDPIMAYTSQMGQFPPSLSNLMANLIQDPNWKGPYLKQTLIDPWGNVYRYQYPGQVNQDTYDVWSLGPDGIPSGDDIGNW